MRNQEKLLNFPRCCL